eukprot:1355429-Rhodomonas_salina.1
MQFVLATHHTTVGNSKLRAVAGIPTRTRVPRVPGYSQPNAALTKWVLGVQLRNSLRLDCLSYPDTR